MRIWYQWDFRHEHPQCLLVDEEGAAALVAFLTSDATSMAPLEGSTINFAEVRKLTEAEFIALDGKIARVAYRSDRNALVGCALIIFVSITLGVALGTVIVQGLQAWLG